MIRARALAGAAAAFLTVVGLLFAPAVLSAPETQDPRAAVVRLSERFDMCHDSHVRLVAAGGTLLATWESDQAPAIYPESASKMEMGWGARWDGANWSDAFGASYWQGATVEAHFGRSAAGADHFLIAYNLRPGSVGIVRFPLKGAAPEADWVLAPHEGFVVQRPVPALVGDRDVVSVVTNDDRFAPPGLRAAVLLNLTAGQPLAGEVIATFPTLALIDALVFNWSGTPAVLLEVEPVQLAPHELLLTTRGATGWSAPVRVAGASGALSSTAADVLVVAGRAFLAYERQRALESTSRGIVLAELWANGSTREVAASPPSSTHSHLSPDMAAMGGRVFVSWTTDDDSLGLGADVDSYYRGLDLATWTLGPTRPLNPPDENASDGDAAIASDGARLFAAWVTWNPTYLDGRDPDVVARYLEGDFDLDGLDDAVDPEPVGGAPPPPPSGPGPLPGPAVAGAAAVAGAGASLSAAFLYRRRGRKGA